jgi:hypothetical protein
MKRIMIQAGNHPYTAPTVESTLVRNSIRGNVGNLMYTNAAFKHMSVPGTEIRVDTKHYRDLTIADAERINDACDVYVLPMANAFKKRFIPHLNILSDLIKELKVPVVVLGVGAQATLDNDTEFLKPVNDVVRRFIGAVLDKSATVGVRGEFTQGYLAELGFKDVDVIGCPSTYLPGPKFRIDKPSEDLPENARIALSTALRVRNTKLVAEINASILKQFPDLTYFAQEGRDLQALYWGDTAAAAGRRMPMPNLTTHPLLQSADACLPLEPHSWIDALAEYDFAVGTRIHGNIAALVAGTPTLVFAHDSRTLELSQYHRIPHKIVTDMTADVDVAQLYAEADFTGFNTEYESGFQRLLDFMTRNGLENAYEHGDGGAEYDKTIAATNFAEPYRRPKEYDQADMIVRITMLREQLQETTRTAVKSEQRASSLANRLKKAEAQLTRYDQRLNDLERSRILRVPARAKRLAKRVLRK